MLAPNCAAASIVDSVNQANPNRTCKAPIATNEEKNTSVLLQTQGQGRGIHPRPEEGV